MVERDHTRKAGRLILSVRYLIWLAHDTHMTRASGGGEHQPDKRSRQGRLKVLSRGALEGYTMGNALP